MGYQKSTLREGAQAKTRTRSMKAVVALPAVSALLALALTACGPHTPIQQCSSGSVTRLYMGQATPSGNVTEAEWQQFITETVTPRFPDGFTVLSAHGQWRGSDGGIRQEETRVLEIVHDDDPQSQAQVRALAHAYKRRFSQESVLLTRLPSFQCS